MKAKDIMSSKLITLESSDPLHRAKQLFDTTKIHHILVIEDNQLIGVLSDRDVYKQLSPTVGTRKETPGDVSALQKQVHLFMKRELVFGTQEMSIKDTILQFHDNHISCLPIIDDKNRPIGIISWRDIIRVIALRYKQKITPQAMKA